MLNQQAKQLQKNDSIVLAKAVMSLFKHWELTQESQCALLGISSSSRKKLKEMESGKTGIPTGRDAQERVGYLLSIHKGLRLLYPKNKEICYGWVSMRNDMFSGATPLEVMLENGYLGLAKVSRYLDMSRGR